MNIMLSIIRLCRLFLLYQEPIYLNDSICCFKGISAGTTTSYVTPTSGSHGNVIINNVKRDC